MSTGEIFGCIKDACEKYQISNTALVNNIKGKTKLCCGCTWSYYDSTQNYPIVFTSSSVQIRNPKKQIYVLELDTVFPTAVAAAKAINCDNSLISKKCKTVSGENYAIVKGYHVRYI